MTTKEVAKRYGVAEITVRKWAEKNNIKREMTVGGIMAYKFTETDCKRFEKRPKKGWKKGRPRNKPAE